MPRQAANANAIQALNLKGPQGALQLPPPVRKPSRGALGGTTPRAGRTRLPPEMAPAQRGGKKKAAPPKKKGAR